MPLITLIAFLSLLGWALATGNFMQESASIGDLPWGVVMLVDLYIGLFIFSFFIYFLERSWVKTGLWTLALIFTGNAASLVYIIYRSSRIKDLFLRN